MQIRASDFAHAVASAPDGKMIVGGATSSHPNGANGDYLLLRLSEDGTLDGSVAVDFGGGESVSDLAVQPDGKIVAGGQARVLRFSEGGGG